MNRFDDDEIFALNRICYLLVLLISNSKVGIENNGFEITCNNRLS